MVSCKQVSCAEDAVQARRRTHARRCYGPASDAEFLRSIADKTPGRGDDDAAAQRRRQVYLKSYVFATKEEEAKARRGGGLVAAVLPPMLLRRRNDRMAAAAAVGAATCSRRAKAGKVLSHLLTRLLSCACNPAAAL
ncbi:unnamed protein product [Urochloa decumbens]|uniref:Uncharacterized protein n=1 Tax=Urochloa decumbens TaxID=240449 RepID=A0ABC9GU05_9POAL